eukprot:CAMPEP_0170503908 /NCGR_PEP_ID=MMETSP0208-20121228/46313_1 /TAXON_ID=197538 /ORGANISM="Strombidium inclinatum, Strain S3" /LENGTH=171 /DNA_ID=CAMNT_0010783833 /DNA_START=1000 /DNA_END=1515 /DNA_ORIENTATION=-
MNWIWPREPSPEARDIAEDNTLFFVADLRKERGVFKGLLYLLERGSSESLKSSKLSIGLVMAAEAFITELSVCFTYFCCCSHPGLACIMESRPAPERKSRRQGLNPTEFLYDLGCRPSDSAFSHEFPMSRLDTALLPRKLLLTGWIRLASASLSSSSISSFCISNSYSEFL